jgi:hypothetical protein
VILQLLAEEGDVALVKDELLALHPKGAAAIYGDWNTTFVFPWIMIVKRDAGWVDELLEDSLKHRRDVPKPALEAALLEVRERLKREGRAQDVETLVAIGCDGPATCAATRSTTRWRCRPRRRGGSMTWRSSTLRAPTRARAPMRGGSSSGR